MKTIYKVIISPVFFLFLALVFLYKAARLTFRFVRFGGETVVYDREKDAPLIGELLGELRERNRLNKELLEKEEK